MIFDYTKHKVVGVAECNSYNDNACIKPIGFLNESWEFIALSAPEIMETFPSRGSIFAYNFKLKQSSRIGKGILIGVMPSNNDGKDSYVWDYSSGAPDEYFTVIKCLNTDLLSGTPDTVFEKIESKGWLNLSEKTYKFFENKIYCIDPKDIKKRFVKVWDLEKLNQKDLQLYSTVDKMYYALLANEIEAPCSYIDIMPNSELDDWLINNFLIPEWQNVLNGENLTNLEDSLRKIIFKCKWPKGVLIPRMNRALHSLESIVLSFEQIKRFMDFPGLKSIIDVSVNHHGSKLLEAIDTKYSKELQERQLQFNKKIEDEEETTEFKILEIQDKIKDAIANYDKTIEKIAIEKKSDLALLDKLNEEISSKREQIMILEENICKLQGNKNRILEDFNVVKDILELINSQPKSIVSSNESSTDEVTPFGIETMCLENLPIKTAETFTKRLESFLQQNNRSNEAAKKLFGYIIHYKTLLIPDNKILLALLKATGNCKYMIQCVSPEWRTFDLLWNHGLSTLVDSCNEHKEVLHYFVLQNCNLTYLPCILQPIVDITLGLMSRFPGTDKQFPENLRIILTITEEEGLPLASQNIKYFGCLKKVSYVIDENRENEIRHEEVPYKGYLSVKIINELSFTPTPQSDYQSYINDYEE